MITSLLFEIEMILATILCTVGVGGFIFTLRHRIYYSVHARSAILFAGVSSGLHAYHFESIREVLEPTGLAIACVLIQMMYSLALMMFTYTILRFKWCWRSDVVNQCGSNSCPLKDPINCPLIKPNK